MLLKDVHKTNLYKAMAKALPHKKAEILRSLKEVVKAGLPSIARTMEERFQETEVTRAFYWEQTPQGHEYWSSLNREVLRAEAA